MGIAAWIGEQLGISDDAVLAREAKLERCQQAVRERWAGLVSTPGYAAKRQRERLASRLKNILEVRQFKQLSEGNTPIPFIKPTKAALNELISWSSSRYNSHTKSEVVESIIELVKACDKDYYESPVWQTGSFSAGAHGHGGGKYGVSNFAVKGNRAGEYQLLIVDGLPYLILDSSDVVCFEGFIYRPFFVDNEFLDAVRQYEDELERCRYEVENEE
jgi:hypothetical protein